MSNSAHAEIISNPPTISLINDHPRTLSTDVAAYFGKNHKNVLRQIRQIMANCQKSFNGLNFEPVEIRDDKGELRPAYSMTKDGFTLLAMGFTGPKAIQFKITYIEAFNWMENKLAEMEREKLALASSSNHLSGEKCTLTEQRILSNLVNTWQTTTAGLSASGAWAQIKARFGVSKVSKMTAAQYQVACAWVQEKIDTAIKAGHRPFLPPELMELTRLKEIVSKSDHEEFISLFEKFPELYNALCQMVRRMAQIVGKCNAVLENRRWAAEGDNTLLKWLSVAFDVHRYQAYGFSGEAFVSIKQDVYTYRAIIEFLHEIQESKKAA